MFIGFNLCVSGNNLTTYLTAQTYYWYITILVDEVADSTTNIKFCQSSWFLNGKEQVYTTKSFVDYKMITDAVLSIAE